MFSIAGDSPNGIYDASVNGHACPQACGESPTLSSEGPGPRAKETWPTHSLQIFSSPKVLVWSTADEGGSNRLKRIYGQYFARLSLPSKEAEMYMENLAFALNARRSLLPWRSFAIASSLKQLHDMQIEWSKPVRAVTNPTLGFIFTGQGAQWYAMGRELLSFSVFKNSIQEAEKCFHGFGCQWSLIGLSSFLAMMQVLGSDLH